MATVAIRTPMEPALTSESFAHQEQPTSTSAFDSTEATDSLHSESRKSIEVSHDNSHHPEDTISPRSLLKEAAHEGLSEASTPSTPGIHVSMADDSVEVKDEAVADETDKVLPESAKEDAEPVRMPQQMCFQH